MSNRAVPGYVLEEMARRSVTNLLIVKPLNAYPGTFELSSWRSACTRVPISKNLKKSQRLPSVYDHNYYWILRAWPSKAYPGTLVLHPQTVKFCWTCTLVQFFPPPADQNPYQGGPIVKKYGLHPSCVNLKAAQKKAGWSMAEPKKGWFFAH